MKVHTIASRSTAGAAREVHGGLAGHSEHSEALHIDDHVMALTMLRRILARQRHCERVIGTIGQVLHPLGDAAERLGTEAMDEYRGSSSKPDVTARAPQNPPLPDAKISYTRRHGWHPEAQSTKKV